MASNETGVVNAIVSAIVKAHPGCWTFKVVGSPFQMTGVPDLLVVIDGLLFGLEVKHVKPGESHEHAINRATPGQRVQIGRLRRAGATADVVTSAAEALAVINHGLARSREK